MSILGSGYVGGTTIPANLPQSAAFPNKSKDPSSPEKLSLTQTKTSIPTDSSAAPSPNESKLGAEIRRNLQSNPTAMAKIIAEKTTQPKEVADILLNLMKGGATVDEVSVALCTFLLGGKDTEKVAKILDEMDPDTAAKILDKMESIGGGYGGPLGKFIICAMAPESAAALLASPYFPKENTAKFLVDVKNLHIPEELQKLSKILLQMCQNGNLGKAIGILICVKGSDEDFYNSQIEFLKGACDSAQINRAVAFCSELNEREKELLGKLCQSDASDGTTAELNMLQTKDPAMVAKVVAHMYGTNFERNSDVGANITRGIEEICKKNSAFGAKIFSAMCEFNETAVAAHLYSAITDEEAKKSLLTELSADGKKLLEDYKGPGVSMESQKKLAQQPSTAEVDQASVNKSKTPSNKLFFQAFKNLLKTSLPIILGCIGCIIGAILCFTALWPLSIALAFIAIILGAIAAYRGWSEVKKLRRERQAEKSPDHPSMHAHYFNSNVNRPKRSSEELKNEILQHLSDGNANYIRSTVEFFNIATDKEIQDIFSEIVKSDQKGNMNAIISLIFTDKNQEKLAKILEKMFKSEMHKGAAVEILNIVSNSTFSDNGKYLFGQFSDESVRVEFLSQMDSKSANILFMNYCKGIKEKVEFSQKMCDMGNFKKMAGILNEMIKANFIQDAKEILGKVRESHMCNLLSQMTDENVETLLMKYTDNTKYVADFIETLLATSDGYGKAAKFLDKMYAENLDKHASKILMKINSSSTIDILLLMGPENTNNYLNSMGENMKKNTLRTMKMQTAWDNFEGRAKAQNLNF
ncbi:MAG: hypothetical protein LBI69_02260 [Puniceicoccales bacterium]|jgi:hypothetical protein|nr:hypothetical protein [Puniceicoccales bacterium]